MTDLDTLERLAYIAGDNDKADLYARITELEAQVASLEETIEDTETMEQWERNNGPVKEYYDFFHDCFKHLAGHYPVPEVTSDYDKSVIFNAIDKAEDND